MNTIILKRSFSTLLRRTVPLLLATFMVLPPNMVHIARAAAPVGYLDTIDGGVARGWAHDSDTPATSVTIQIYIDNLPVVAFSTDQVRPDVNTHLGRPAGETHGFAWAIPDNYRDGRTYALSVYAIDTANSADSPNRELTGSAQKFSLGGTGPSDQGITVTSPATGETWKPGETYTIRWENLTLSPLGAKVTISLDQYIACLYTAPQCAISQVSPYQIANGVTNTGSFAWTIPSDFATTNPRHAGSTRITVAVENTGLYGTSGVFTIGAGGTSANPLTLSSASSLSGTVNQPFSASFTVSGGSVPYQKWVIVSGSLPTGLALSFPAFNCITTPCIPPKDEAIVSGTPTVSGSFTPTIRVTDSSGRTVEKVFKFVIVDTNSKGSVSSPVAGDIWQTGKTYTIKWVAPTITAGTVQIELEPYIACLHNELYVCELAQPAPLVITSATPNTGGFNWAIPADLAIRYVGNSQRIVIRYSDGSSIASGVFQIQQGTSVDTIRTGYVDVATGQRVDGWAYDRQKSQTCVIITYRQTVGGDSRTIEEVCPTITRTDAEDWLKKNHGTNLSVTQPLGFRGQPERALNPGTYIVESVKHKDSGVLLEMSESAKFPITVADTAGASGPIVITSPTKGVTWNTGETRTITWSGHNNLPLKIQLQAEYVCNAPLGTVCPAVMPQPITIAENVPGSNTSYAWTIPSNLSGGYRISISTTASGVDYVLWGKSAKFTINNGGVSASPLQVSKPAAGDVVTAGTVTTIHWNVLADTQGFPVTIKYNQTIRPACLDSNPPCAVPETLTTVHITTNAPNTGSYAWTVPATLSGKYTVTVSYASYSDESGLFTVGSYTVPGSPLSITVQDPIVATVGQQLDAVIGVSGGSTPYTVELDEGSALPEGVTFVIIPVTALDCAAGSTTCPTSPPYTLSGIPSEAGEFPIIVKATDSKSNTVIKETRLSVTESGDASVPLPGQLVRGENSNTIYYITEERLKYAFTTLAEFTRRGFKLRNVETISEASLARLLDTTNFMRASGASFRYRGTRTVYYLSPARCKEAYPSQATMRVWGVVDADVFIVSTEESYADCSPSFVRFPDNRVVRVSGLPAIYLTSGSVLRPFASFEAFTRMGFTTRDIFIISAAERNLYTVGDPIN